MGYSKKAIASLLIVTAIFTGGIGATIHYYNGLLVDKNSKIASLNSQIANQQTQIANQQTQIANLTSQVKLMSNYIDAHLEATLVVTEVGNMSESMSTYPFYRLYITGTVKNTGRGEALNAGLHIIASASNEVVEINMTVPLVSLADFGTDSSTNAFVQGWDAGSGISANPSQFSNLNSGGSVGVEFNIYHEGQVINWTVTPVWTNLP
ncbi:MAG: hypothetical protein ABSF65_11140 [Candidatus Bathyarchaeia archaeon]|jgi:hypothetical protein